MRKRKNKFYFIIILISFFCLSIGYALINRNLSITGNSEVKSNSWDINFEYISVKGGSVETTTPATINDTCDGVNFAVDLNLPGDFYEFNVFVSNVGTIDGMIDSIIKTPELTSEQQKYINYTISYANEEIIQPKQLISAGLFVVFKVKVEYRTDIDENDLPTQFETLNLGFIVNYVQADNTAVKVKDDGYLKNVHIINQTPEAIGSEVCIEEECFYLMSFDENELKFTLLSKYNLNVGNIVYEDGSVVPISNPTGIQDSNALGGFEKGEEEPPSEEEVEEVTEEESNDVQYPFYGTVSFSNKNYWYDAGENYFKPGYDVEISNEGMEALTPKADVYNEESSLFEINENYKKYLESSGLNILKVRPIVRNELIELGCEFPFISFGPRCLTAPSWVYSTSYWASTALVSRYGYEELDWNSGLNVYGVFRVGDADLLIYNNQKILGVRPVIEISYIDFLTAIEDFDYTLLI